MYEKINYRQQWLDGEIGARALLDAIDHLTSEVERYKVMSDNYYTLGVDRGVENTKLKSEIEQLKRKLGHKSSILTEEPVAAQIRYRYLQKNTPDWSIWQIAPIDTEKPDWWIDSVGHQVEYRLLYTRCKAHKGASTDDAVNTAAVGD